MKRVVFYKLHSPSVLLLQDGIARGRFGAFPKELYASKWNWPALRIARYYDRYSGTYKGIDFHYRGLEALLGMKPVAT